MKNIVYLLVALSLLIVPSYSFAKTYAYFIGPKGKAVKLDSETNAVAQLTLKRPGDVDLDKVLGADIVNKKFFCNTLRPFGTMQNRCLFPKYIKLHERASVNS